MAVNYNIISAPITAVNEVSVQNGGLSQTMSLVIEATNTGTHTVAAIDFSIGGVSADQTSTTDCLTSYIFISTTNGGSASLPTGIASATFTDEIAGATVGNTVKVLITLEPEFMVDGSDHNFNIDIDGDAQLIPATLTNTDTPGEFNIYIVSALPGINQNGWGGDPGAYCNTTAQFPTGLQSWSLGGPYLIGADNKIVDTNNVCSNANYPGVVVKDEGGSNWSLPFGVNMGTPFTWEPVASHVISRHHLTMPSGPGMTQVTGIVDNSTNQTLYTAPYVYIWTDGGFEPVNNIFNRIIIQDSDTNLPDIDPADINNVNTFGLSNVDWTNNTVRVGFSGFEDYVPNPNPPDIFIYIAGDAVPVGIDETYSVSYSIDLDIQGETTTNSLAPDIGDSGFTIEG